MPNLHTLPFDIIFNLASSLSLEDFTHLSRVNRQLHVYLDDEGLCRKTIEQTIYFTREAEECRTSTDKQRYRKALLRAYNRRRAAANGQPCSVSHLGFCDAFIMSEGVLCYISGDDLRILDSLNSSGIEQVIHIPTAVSSTLKREEKPNGSELSLLNYADDVLVCLYNKEEHDDSWIIAFDAPRGKGRVGEVIAAFQPSNTTRIFARNTARYICYGTHSERGAHGHREWVVYSYDIESRRHIGQGQLLKHFVGCDVGVTVDFKMLHGYFYALSNQTSFDVEEVDWTSFYHCYRFRPETADSLEIMEELWRRQHSEGPINDSWTNLSIEIEEQTGQPLIVESRREWHGGGSTSQRTHYFEPLIFLPKPRELTASILSSFAYFLSAGTLDERPVPPGDIMSTMVSEKDNYNYSPAQVRPARNVHSESKAPNASCIKDFILARTKLHTYQPANRTFLDLVDDPIQPSSATGWRSQQRLRLKVGSRMLKPVVGGQALQYRPDGLVAGEEGENNLDEFRYSAITLFPPDNAPRELWEIMNPSSYAGQVEGLVDERSLVYMTGSSRKPVGRALVFVSFDPKITFPGLEVRKLQLGVGNAACNLGRASGSQFSTELRKEREVTRGEHGKLSGHSKNSEGHVPLGQDMPWCRCEPAKYLTEGKGIFLSY